MPVFILNFKEILLERQSIKISVTALEIMRPHSLYTRQRSEVSRKGMRSNVYEICASEYPFLRFIIHLRKSVFHLPSPCSQILWTSPSTLFTYKTARKLRNWKGFGRIVEKIKLIFTFALFQNSSKYCKNLYLYFLSTLFSTRLFC